VTIKIDYFADGFSLLGPLAAGVLLVANSIAMRGTKRTSLLNWIASIASASFCHCFYYCCWVYSFQELKFGTLFSEWGRGCLRFCRCCVLVLHWVWYGCYHGWRDQEPVKGWTNWLGWFNVYNHCDLLLDGFGIDGDGQIYREWCKCCIFGCFCSDWHELG